MAKLAKKLKRTYTVLIQDTKTTRTQGIWLLTASLSKRTILIYKYCCLSTCDVLQNDWLGIEWGIEGGTNDDTMMHMVHLGYIVKLGKGAIFPGLIFPMLFIRWYTAFDLTRNGYRCIISFYERNPRKSNAQRCKSFEQVQRRWF